MCIRDSSRTRSPRRSTSHGRVAPAARARRRGPRVRSARRAAPRRARWSACSVCLLYTSPSPRD
eukprot:1718148-Alexandrium_andersonii.AAC.1